MTDFQFQDSKYYPMFKAYDVRAIAGENSLNSSVYYFSAQGFAKTILLPENLPKKVCVAYDARTTSYEFYKAFIAGLNSVGFEALPLGQGASDFLYAGCIFYDLPGVVITASHNPKEYNGLKIIKKVPNVVGLESGLSKIRDYVINAIEVDGQKIPENLPEILPNQEAVEKVVQFFLERVLEIGSVEEVDKILKSQNRRFKIVADAANGMGGVLMERVAKLYKNIDFTPLYWQADGNFPNHPADPTEEENHKDLKNEIKNIQADLGAMFDGDGDRCVLVDENQNLIMGDYLVATMANYIIKETRNNPNSKHNPVAVFPQNNSRCIWQAVFEADGCVAPTRQGHVYIKSEMAKYNAVYGGEGSGHHYFGQFGFMDSGILNLVLSIKILITKNIKASQMNKKWQDKYLLSGEKNFKLSADLSMQKVKEKLKQHYQDAVFSEMDGLIITYEDWRVAVRSSNTEPLLRFNVETISTNPSINPEIKLDEVLRVSGIK